MKKATLEKKSEKLSKTIAIATHPRSGTHLTIDLLRKQFRECQSGLGFGETLHHSYLNLDHLAPDSSPRISQQEAIALLHRCGRPIIKTHSLPTFERLTSSNFELIDRLWQQTDIYYVVRDGRDVLCSAHLWMQCFDPSTRCSLSQFIRQEQNGMSRPRFWAHHVSSWLHEPGVVCLKFEEIVKNTDRMVDRLGRELGLQPLYKQPLLPKRKRSDNRWADYWRRLTRQWESTAIVGRYRGQKPKRWQEAWTREDREFFHREAGDVLMELGYATSDGPIERTDSDN